MRSRHVLLLALWLGGCNSGHHQSSDGGVALDLATAASFDLRGVAADLTVAADLEDAACNDLTLTGAPILTVPYLASDIPAFTGGTILDGSYILTSGGVYTGPGGMTGNFPGTFQARYRFAGSHVDFLADIPAGIASDAATFAVDDNGLTITPSCPSDADSIALAYTATSTSLTLGMPSGTMGSALVLTKE